MRRLIDRCAGIDVGQALLVVCVRVVDEKGRVDQQVRSFGATTPDLLDLRDWLAAARCAVGLTPEPEPRHRPDALTATEEDQKEQLDTSTARLDDSGATDKQGSRLVRWAAVEAVQRVPGQTRLGQIREDVGRRRGRNIGVVAAARELVELVFYGLRDHHIRCLPAHGRPRRAASPVAG